MSVYSSRGASFSAAAAAPSPGGYISELRETLDDVNRQIVTKDFEVQQLREAREEIACEISSLEQRICAD